jgi:lysyl-tRNA synthetase class II
LNNQKKKNNIPPAGGTDNTPVQIPLTELVRIRRNKVRELQKSGINPYPYRFVRTHRIDELLRDFDAIAESETVVRLAGRVMLKRKMERDGRPSGRAGDVEAEDGQIVFCRRP